MSSQIDGHVLEAIAGEAIELNRLVRLNSTTSHGVVKCKAGETPIGVCRAAVASGGSVGVQLINKPGTHLMVADAAITANSRVYAGYDGKVSAFGLGPILGYALTAATAAGDWIEVLVAPQLAFSLNPADQFVLFDDFFMHDATEGPFLVTGDAGATGTTDVIDGAGGIMSVVCDGDDNDEKYLHTAVECCKIANGKPLYAEFRVAFTEGSTNKAAIILGLMDAAGADALVDTEAGPKASYSGVVFWKVSGTLALSAEASIAGTQTAITMASAPAHVSGTYAKYGILIVPTTAALANVYVFINDTLVGSLTDWTYTNATDMDAIVGVKSDGSAEETALVDYILVRQAR